MNQNSTINVALTVSGTATVNGAGTALTDTLSTLLTLTNGTGANQANTIYESKAVSIAASGSTTLDLNGVLTDYTGATINFTKVKLLYVKAASTNVNDVQVGGVGANGWVAPFGSTSDKVNVKPGGVLLLLAPDVNGYTVTAATADLLKIANSSSGTAVVFDIVLIGL